MNAKGAGYEADDFVASAVTREEKRGGTALVASGDRDMFQLASERTTILYPVRAGEVARITPAEVRVRYGVDPQQVPDFIALRGDPSDKLPGAKNVGAQGAANLLRRYGTLEALLKAGRFASQAEELRQYRAIATMDRKAPLPPLRDQTPTWDKAAALARSGGSISSPTVSPPWLGRSPRAGAVDAALLVRAQDRRAPPKQIQTLSPREHSVPGAQV